MESLFARAASVDVVDCRLPSGRVAHLRRLVLPLGRASPDRLPEGSLAPTYTSKPLVTFNGAAMFGELALLKWLELDGWEGVWLDTFHGRKAWRAMPTVATPVRLPPAAQELYDRILVENGGRASGTFDVMAWRGAQTIFLEYDGPADRSNKHAAGWIDAALSVGVSEHDLILVTGTVRDRE